MTNDFFLLPFGVFSSLPVSFHFCLAGPDLDGTVPVLLSLLYELGGREQRFRSVVWARPAHKNIYHLYVWKICIYKNGKLFWILYIFIHYIKNAWKCKDYIFRKKSALYSQFIGTNLKLKYKRSKTMQMQINYVP